jgi:hypothetical protein
MGFWNTGAEPLRQFRWYMVFGGNTAGGPVSTSNNSSIDSVRYALKKVDKPKAKVAEITHKYLNHFYYYPGRLEWESINMTIAATLKPSVDDVLYNVLLGAGYQYPASYSEDRTISKPKFNKALGDTISIIQISSDGKPIEEWLLKKPFFTSVQFGALDYASEEIVDIQCTIRYDSAQLKQSSADGNGTSPGASLDEVAEPTSN